MRIQAKDLPIHLKKGLTNFYFVFGDEPLQHKESVDAVRAEAKLQGFSEREIFDITAGFEWGTLLESLNTSNLFFEKRLIECHFAESIHGKALTEAFHKIAEFVIANDVLFLLIAKKIETKFQQSKAFIAIEQKACTILARALTQDEMKLWLDKRLLANQFQIDPESVQLLLERTEGNLLAAAQAIEKLQLCASHLALRPEDIVDAIGMDARFSIFDLIDAALSASVKRTTQILNALRQEGVDPILIIWAIAKEVRTISLLMHKAKEGNISSAQLSELGIWKRREFIVRRFIQRFSLTTLQPLFLKMKEADDILKGRQPGDVWGLLFSICQTLTGAYYD